MTRSRVRAASLDPDATQTEMLVPVELHPQAKPRRRPTPYQRILVTTQAMRRIGELEDRGYGAAGRTIVAHRRFEHGTITATLSAPVDHFRVDFVVTIEAPTPTERAAITETCANSANLLSFSALFDLLAVRSEVTTFDPTDTQGVLDALDSIFGPR